MGRAQITGGSINHTGGHYSITLNPSGATNFNLGPATNCDADSQSCLFTGILTEKALDSIKLDELIGTDILRREDVVRALQNRHNEAPASSDCSYFPGKNNTVGKSLAVLCRLFRMLCEVRAGEEWGPRCGAFGRMWGKGKMLALVWAGGRQARTSKR